VLESLKETERGWLIDILYAFNAGERVSNERLGGEMHKVMGEKRKVMSIVVRFSRIESE
jgi:hypothetical protein